jgi:hypothetical protein
MKTIITIDADIEFHKRFINRLKYNKIDDKYNILNITPNTTLDENSIIENTIEQVHRSIEI